MDLYEYQAKELFAAQAKKDALEAAGVKLGKTPSETAQLTRQILEASR